MLTIEATQTFSPPLDSGYLVLWPTTPIECERNASVYVKVSPIFRFGAKQAHTSHTSFVVVVDPEVDGHTQQKQQHEEAAGDSSCNASDGGSAQPAA